MTRPEASTLAPPQRVLILKPSALGDVVTALPVLRGLRRTFPQAHIAWLLAGSCAGLLQDDSDLDEIVYFHRRHLGRWWYRPDAHAALWSFWWTLRRGRYDWVIDLQGLLRSGLFTHWTHAKVRAGFADAREGAPLFYTHRLDCPAEHTVDRNIELARQLGIDARPEDMRLQVQPEARQAIATLRSAHGLTEGNYILCVPPTRWATKVYPVRHWRRVVASLAKHMPVVLLGSPAPAERQLCQAVAAEQGADVIDLAGQTSLPELVALIAESAGVVCSDSAAKFIAPAVGRNVVTLIGPTQTERTGPYLQGRALVAETACQGCLKKRCSHITCMASIEPATVVEAVMDQIGQSPPCP